MVGQAQLEVDVRPLMQGMPATQFGGVDQRLAAAVETLEMSNQRRRVEGSLDVLKACIISLVKKRGVAPQMCAQLALQLALQAQIFNCFHPLLLIKTVTDVAAEQLIGALAGE